MVKMDESKSKSLKIIQNLPKWGKIVQSLPKYREHSYTKCTKMNEMDQNEPSKGTEMSRNVPTRAQLTKIGQNRGNPDTKMNQMG